MHEKYRVIIVMPSNEDSREAYRLQSRAILDACIVEQHEVVVK